jgi:hypothetical protein
MLYRLEIENFFAIREKQVIDIRVPHGIADDDGRFAPIFPGASERAARTIAIYGANASGKSTLLRAPLFLAGFMRNALPTPDGSPALHTFNDADRYNRPVRLAAECAGVFPVNGADPDATIQPPNLEFGCLRYEVSLVWREEIGWSVDEELCRFRPGGVGKWRRVFERDVASGIKGSAYFPLTGYTKIIDKLRADTSLVAMLAQFDHAPAQRLVDAAKLVYTNILHPGLRMEDARAFEYYARDPEVLRALNREIRRIDLGIGAVVMTHESDGRPAPEFCHTGLNTQMPWAMESHGTKSFVRLFPVLHYLSRSGGIGFVDEIDQAIHPLLLPEILRRFRLETTEKNPAQLWFACHTASLLTELTKEEILLCEKDSTGAVRVYRLKDVADVRRDENLFRKYMTGVYGGVPLLG